MAKATAPFMSIGASGTIAKTLTASHWKGRPYLRHRVIPLNPKSTGQKVVRSALGTIAKACTAVLTKFVDTMLVGSAFFQAGVSMAPAGQSWISFLQRSLNSAFSALVTSYGALSSTIKGYYVTGATDATLSDYTDKSGDVQTNGFQLYLLASFAVNQLGYTGFTSGIDSATSAEITAFVTYVHVTV